MHRVPIAVATALVMAQDAAAECGGRTVFSCRSGEALVAICLAADSVNLTITDAGETRIFISSPLVNTHYIPWDGWTREMVESVGFEQSGNTFVVYAAVEKPLDPEADDGAQHGGVLINFGKPNAMELHCDERPDPFQLELIFDAIVSQGRCWDWAAKVWHGNCKP